MATTTNYGWTTPDDTALVKDGAAAIRTLGSSVDTSVKSLSPGTTSGDLDYYTSATAKARIGIGTNGQILTSNGTIPTWAAAPAANSMTLLSTTSLSSTSTTVSSISQSYTNLMVVFRGWTYSSNAVWRIRPNANAGLTCAQYIITGTAGSTSSGELIAATGGTQQGGSNVQQILLINNYASTSYVKPFQSYGVTEVGSSSNLWGGFFNTTSAITSMQFGTVAGTSTFSAGQILIYGVN
jgi:hypothetical protein